MGVFYHANALHIADRGGGVHMYGPHEEKEASVVTARHSSLTLYDLNSILSQGNCLSNS